MNDNRKGAPRLFHRHAQALRAGRRLTPAVRDGLAYVLNGESLRQRVKREGPMTLRQAAASSAGVKGWSSAFRRASNSSRMRASTMSGSLRVTTTRVGWGDLGMSAMFPKGASPPAMGA